MHVDPRLATVCKESTVCIENPREAFQKCPCDCAIYAIFVLHAKGWKENSCIRAADVNLRLKGICRDWVVTLGNMHICHGRLMVRRDSVCPDRANVISEILVNQLSIL